MQRFVTDDGYTFLRINNKWVDNIDPELVDMTLVDSPNGPVGEDGEPIEGDLFDDSVPEDPNAPHKICANPDCGNDGEYTMRRTVCPSCAEPLKVVESHECPECGEPVRDGEECGCDVDGCHADDGEDRDGNPLEPDDDAITTTDHIKFYQYGKLVFTYKNGEDGNETAILIEPRGAQGQTYINNAELTTVEAALRRYMDEVQFWPDAWFISDHGNAHRIDLSEVA